MLLKRLDTLRNVYVPERTPNDCLMASDTLQLDWDKERGVVLVSKVTPSADVGTAKKKAKPEVKLVTIVPLSAVADMWPADE